MTNVADLAASREIYKGLFRDGVARSRAIDLRRSPRGAFRTRVRDYLNLLLLRERPLSLSGMVDYVPSYFLALHGIESSTTFFAKNILSPFFSLFKSRIYKRECSYMKSDLLLQYVRRNLCL